MFCHEKLQVYRQSVELMGAMLCLIKAIPAGNADIVGQLRRAAMSILLNVAEGAGKTGANDKRRFYSIARGSALECAAVLDLLRAWELVDAKMLSEPLSRLEHIAAMLAALSLK